LQDLHEKWQHRWLNSKAEARQSGIEGLGVFAKEKIEAGETVGVLGGVIVHRDRIAEYRSIMSQVGIQIDHDFFIVPTTREELKKYGVFNHSCAPNIGFSGSLSLIAMRVIESEEELVFDYAFCEIFFPSFSCACKSAGCREEITQEDWKKPEIQEKYKSYFSPFLREKILSDPCQRSTR
jgi:uncharacterized protein